MNVTNVVTNVVPRCWFTGTFNFPEKSFAKSLPLYEVKKNEHSSRQH
jgi:hypothetical protein